MHSTPSAILPLSVLCAGNCSLCCFGERQERKMKLSHLEYYSCLSRWKIIADKWTKYNKTISFLPGGAVCPVLARQGWGGRQHKWHKI